MKQKTPTGAFFVYVRIVQMLSSKKFIFIFSFAIIFLIIATFFAYPSKKAELILGGKLFLVEVSDTNVSRSRGLSGHRPLEKDGGMLFIFDKPDLYGFWMKDMKFAIDIIWIDENLKISHIEKSVLPETYPKIFYPETPSLYVLEIKAGESEKMGLKVGEVIEFSRK